MIDLQGYVTTQEAAGLAAKDAIIAARDATIVALQAQLDACLAGNPPPPPGDTTAPSAPRNLGATVLSSTQITVTWVASTDAVGVTGYKIFRAGVEVGARVGTSFADAGLTAATAYTYTVKAHDAAGNLSVASAPVTAMTSAAAPPPGGFVWAGINTIWPTAATTGPRIALTAAASNNVSGLVKGKSFTGTVYPANGTVLEDCEITINGNSHGIDGAGKTYTVRNSRLKVTGNTNRQQGVLGCATTSFCDISGFEDAVRPTGGGWSLRASFIHNLSTAADAHNDGIQAFEGPGVIEQNYIAARDTSAVMVQSITNSSSNAPGGVIVRHNYLSGGVPLRIESECKGKGCQAYENAIVRGDYNMYSDLSGADANYGNIDAVTGAAI